MRMLHGAQLAVEEANARGGYGGKPFKPDAAQRLRQLAGQGGLWRRPAHRPDHLGFGFDEAVKMIYDDQDWAIFGSISSESTHIILRVALKAEIPIVNSASTDPTIPETYIPWYFTDLQDDRVQSYTLARRIFTELGLKRVALLRVNNRYGRFGVLQVSRCGAAAGTPGCDRAEVLPGDTDFSRQLQVIRTRAPTPSCCGPTRFPRRILKQMRALGMKQRVFGSYRTLGPSAGQAGARREGFEAVFPYDPTRNDPRWLDFNRRFEAASTRSRSSSPRWPTTR
jgi:branched-chain amino acid transport system substrate-binding protein